MTPDIDGIDTQGCAIEPMNGHVCIRPDPPDSKTRGGIYLPDSAKSDKRQGTVVALPRTDLDYRPDAWKEGADMLIGLALQVGDRVVYPTGYETEIEYEGEEFVAVAAAVLVVRLRGKA